MMQSNTLPELAVAWLRALLSKKAIPLDLSKRESNYHGFSKFILV